MLHIREVLKVSVNKVNICAYLSSAVSFLLSGAHSAHFCDLAYLTRLLCQMRHGMLRH